MKKNTEAGSSRESSAITKALLLTITVFALSAAVAGAHGEKLDQSLSTANIKSLHSARFLDLQQSVERRNGASQSWEDVAGRDVSPRAIAEVVKERIQYAPDVVKEDEWRSGRETWARRQGDCEDIAAAVKDLSEANGYKAEIYVVQSKTARSAHAVTIGKTGETMWMSSNGSYEVVKSLDDAKEKIARALGWWVPEVTIVKAGSNSRESRRGELVVAADTRR